MALKFSTRFPYMKKRSNAVAPEDLPVQRIIIPQGLVNPRGVTIIEIPQNMQDVPAVIAKPIGNVNDSYSDFFPVTSSSVRDSHLFPKDSNASASLGASQYSISACSSRSSPVQVRSSTCPGAMSGEPPGLLTPCGSTSRPIGMNIERKSKSFPRTDNPQFRELHDSGVTYGGMPYDFSQNKSGTFYQGLKRMPPKAAAPPIGMTINKKSRSFPRTDYPNMAQLHESGVTYGGMPQDFSPNKSGTFYQHLKRRMPAPVPPIGMNIVPKSKSFPRAAQPVYPEMYENGVTYGGMGYDYSPNTSGTFYKDYIQDYTSIIAPHNESAETGYDYSDPERRARGFDPLVHGEEFKRQFSQYMNFEPPACSTPQNYTQAADTSLQCNTTPCEPPSYLVPRTAPNPYKRPGRTESRITPSGLKKVLDNLDVVELSRIKNDLKDFQMARRRLLFDATNLKH